jgi:hypothetical protein
MMRASFLLGLSAVAAFLVASCGGSTIGGRGEPGDAGSVGPTLPADAFVAITMSPVKDCPYPATTRALLGQSATGRPTTVWDGAPVPGGSVHVTCSLQAMGGDGFWIGLYASLPGPMGGEVNVHNANQPIFSASDGPQQVIATFVWPVGEGFEGSAQPCTLTFTYQGKPVPDYPPIGGGRFWGHVSCPTEQPQIMPVGQCDLELDVLFENCLSQ